MLVAQRKQSRTDELVLAWRLAVRELRGGLKGFYVFFLCIALGVAVIAAVGSLADALRTGFDRQGMALLGGDVAVSRPHARATGEERAWLASRGQVSEIATVRAMARDPGGGEQALVEIKGIDQLYPMAGELRLSDAAARDALRTSTDVLVEPILLERLRLAIGDQIVLGKTTHRIAGTILAEPDKVAERLTVGPRVMIASVALADTGLIDPGSLVNWRYAVLLNDGRGAEGVTALRTFRDELARNLPEAGFTVRDRRDPSPNVTRTLERLRQFLTLLGLTALIVGGVGVANAVATYIDKRRQVIAVFKSLGATNGLIFGLHLFQVLVMAVIGIMVGLVAGTALTYTAATLAGSALPIQADIGISAAGLGLATVYGLLVALVFILWPLGRAEQVSPTVLFRDEVDETSSRPRAAIMVATLLAVVTLASLAIFSAEARMLAAYYVLAVCLTLGGFWALGWLTQWLAARSPRPRRRPVLALAIADVAAPGGLARSVILSLGTGLSFLVAIALVDRSIVAEIEGRVPATSPNYFMLDIKRDELPAFKAVLRRLSPEVEIYTAPMLRGRIVRVGVVPAEQARARPEHAWVLSGDRGLSYSVDVPDGSTVVEGRWWEPDYQGSPLVSMEAEIARGLGLKLGDSITVNVLGRNITARIHNLRDVKWESLALNFVLVFSPNTLAAAPHNVLATVTLPKSAPLALEAEVAREVGKQFPAVSAIRVKDAINQFNAIFSRVMTAVRVASGLTLLAGALVLAGALATAQRRRVKQAVILKTLGATRRTIVAIHLAEYALLALATAVVAAVLGGAAAWAIVTMLMQLPFVLSPSALLQALVVALVLIAMFGGFGTVRILSARPMAVLRSE